MIHDAEGSLGTMHDPGLCIGGSIGLPVLESQQACFVVICIVGGRQEGECLLHVW